MTANIPGGLGGCLVFPAEVSSHPTSRPSPVLGRGRSVLFFRTLTAAHSLQTQHRQRRRLKDIYSHASKQLQFRLWILCTHKLSLISAAAQIRVGPVDYECEMPGIACAMGIRAGHRETCGGSQTQQRDCAGVRIPFDRGKIICHAFNR